MPPLFAAIIAAGLTVSFFALFHARISRPWLRNILIVVATIGSMGIGASLVGTPEAGELMGQIYAGLLVISYLAWKFVLKRFFVHGDSAAARD